MPVDRLCKCGHQLGGHTRDEGCPCGVEGCACKYFCEDSVPETSSVYSAWRWAADGYPGSACERGAYRVDQDEGDLPVPCLGPDSTVAPQ